MNVIIPDRLARSCSRTPERVAWLKQLPVVVAELAARWAISIEAPFDHSEVSCAWVAPATRADGMPVVVKISMPHMEAEHEIDGLRFWDGDPTVNVLEADQPFGAMLLERCTPGTSLRSIPETDQDTIIVDLLLRVWRVPPTTNPFRPLSALTTYWCGETRADAAHWTDAELVQEGLRVFEDLARMTDDSVLLATDLHAGNVLRASREPWLVIDPKPFVGERAYDATQHILNCRERLHADPNGMVKRFARLLDIDHERLRLWLFARAAAEPRDSWDAESMATARLLKG